MYEVVGRSFPVLPYEAAAEWHEEERARLDAVGRSATFVDGQIAALPVSPMASDRLATRTDEPAILTIAPPPDAWNLSPNGATSPDGRMIAIGAFVDGVEQRNLRQTDQAASARKRIPGTSGARHPFWSPDSRQVAFFAQRRRISVPIGGAPVTVLADVGRIATATGGWGQDGLYFAAQWGPLRRVTPGGSTVVFPLEGDEDRVRKPIPMVGGSRTRRAAETLCARRAPSLLPQQ